MHPAKVGRLLQTDVGLQPVVAKALELAALSRLCVEFLPPELARNLRAVNLKDGRLVLLAATPAAAAKLKLQSESLGKFLSDRRVKVNSVSVRVQPAPPHVAEVTPRGAHLSAAGLRALRELYQRLPDSPARSALKTLLDHQFKR
ncbi:MAG: DciA family protein [Pseudomonadota bacterium]